MPQSFNANNLLTKPVYDTAFYGNDLHLPLGLAPLSVNDITWNTIDELKVVDADIENYSRIISDSSGLSVLNKGDGVAFDHTYNWLSDTSAWIYKFNITIACALAVTAWTSGDHSVDSVRIILTERLKDGTLVQTLADIEKNTGMTTLNGTGEEVAIVTFENDQPFKISKGNFLRLQLILGRTDTLVATSFEGIMPLFYFQITGRLSQLIESTMNLRLYPALDNSFTVFRDQSLQEGLDYDGVTQDGKKR